jgi:hypothetical protein
MTASEPLVRNIRDVFPNENVEFNKIERRQRDADSFDNLQPRVAERKTHALRTKNLLRFQHNGSYSHSRYD